jgi:stage IV sporulation protein B
MKSIKRNRIFAVLSALLIALTVVSPVASVNADGFDTLIPGGMAFGVKFFTDGAVVLGTTGVETAEGVVSPAKDCGLKAGDIITKAGGNEFDSASELIAIIAGSGGKDIHITFVRGDEEKTVRATPVKDIESDQYKIGIFVKDSTAGIGTVTFIDPETLDFGGLGHGIYESETGVLLPLERGAVVDVDITDVIRSERNDPGELRGSFDKKVKGELWENCDQGVFGRFHKLPENTQEPIPVAKGNDIEEGKAHVLTTLSGTTVEEFEIEIEKIYHNSGEVKNFLVKITDERLLDKTGGIVQGMSGSPIIQNGKLVGAVTHVLVNDPTHGYGILIENMLNSAFDVGAFNSQFPLAA